MKLSSAWIVFIVILGLALTRILPHPPNFSPILAIALFSGAILKDRRLAFGVPLLAMLLSDLIIGFHSLIWLVYLSFIAVVYMGTFLQTQRKLVAITGVTISGSLLFFLITNLGVWAFDGMYPMTFSGLLSCYTAALPFLQNSMAGDLFFVAILFGGYALLQNNPDASEAI
jgi:hypothetical protein